MNISLQGMDLFGNIGLKSIQERLDRQAKRDNQIAFYEQQKENLKNMKANTLEEISRKLELFHGYENQIAAAKMEYNNSQMFHVFDEAQELAEKIAEAAEKNKPKTPEERREDMIEEATGVEESEGLLSEVLDELTDVMDEVTEEITEETVDELEEITEELDPLAIEEKELIEKQIKEKENLLPENYQGFDYRI
ncbi:hypothetical protein [Pseudobutyrivibrio sp.]|uniref:hypothetical protein n=1 Tax=Pseudobutyrivibrio sp. TaxID=2014367 RepID=UPI002600785C|nr:hypothetical protein [Pseudobutyrivibrio sp.]MBR5649165.1 hypothetical protein [Pseudobutyrivibrio sp.]